MKSPPLTAYPIDMAPNPAEAAELAESEDGADTTREEQAVQFALSLFATGDVRTITNRVTALRWLFGIDQRPLASLARDLGVSRPRMNQIRDALAVRLEGKGVRVRRREHLRNRGT